MSRSNHHRKDEPSARGGLPPPFDRLVRGLSSRYLLVALGALFALDLVFPDPVPFADEAILGLATLLLARWQSRTKRGVGQNEDVGPKPPPKNVTPGP